MKNAITTYIPPDYIRLPKPGDRCPISGLSRTTLIELSVPSPCNDFRPPVESKHIKRPGAQRGIRLISRTSLLSYLASLSA